VPTFLTKEENKMLSSIIGPIGSLASTWLQGRVDKAKAETDVKVAKAKAEAKVYETEGRGVVNLVYSRVNVLFLAVDTGIRQRRVYIPRRKHP